MPELKSGFNGSPLTISPERTFAGKRNAFFVYRHPPTGMRSKRSVGLASKFTQPTGALKPQPKNVKVGPIGHCCTPVKPNVELRGCAL